MNRLEPSQFCRICGMDLRARWDVATLVRMRIEWNRMMDNGMCDGCQSDRLEAAMEYENAAAEVRMVMALGANWSSHRPPRLHPVLLRARQRLAAADRWCVRLKMWPADRPVREGKPCPSPCPRAS